MPIGENFLRSVYGLLSELLGFQSKRDWNWSPASLLPQILSLPSLFQEDDDIAHSLAKYLPLIPCGFLRKRFPNFHILKLVDRAEYIHSIVKNKKGKLRLPARL